jgi:hypothetical protein
MAQLREYRIQLKDAASGQSIISAGGVCHVSQAGSPDKAALYDKTGAALSNPVALTRGFINFFTADTLDSVDLYIMAPGGQFVVREGIVASGPNEIVVDTARKEQTAKIPFSYVDQRGDALETDSGFDLPATCIIPGAFSGLGLLVTAADATETIDVGTGQAFPVETGGDANGLIAASSVGTPGLVVGTNGALISSNVPYKSDANPAKSITWTLTTGADTAKGFILLPYTLA